MTPIFRLLSPGGNAKRNSRGQALPLGLAFIAFGVLLTVVLFNSGQLVSEKSRLSNTADAAAYSGLVWQARALNFNAYTNRAMVANQVSIAQLVSLRSWTQYGDIAARNVNNTIGLIPFLRPFTQAVASAMTEINEIVGMIVDIAIPVVDGVIQALSGTQQAVYLSTFGITPALVREVVEANDPDFNVESTYAIASLGENALAWRNFTQRYDEEDGLLRKADVINRSRDRFTRDRGWDIGRFYISPVNREHLIKEGTTQLVYNSQSGEWAWIGKDTLSLHSGRYRCSWRGCRWRTSELPIGWGAAYSPEEERCRRVSRRQSDSGFEYENRCNRFVRHNRRGERLADAESEDVGNYSGVQAYYDMTDLSEENRDPRMHLRIEVQKSASDLRTSTHIGIGSPDRPDAATVQNGLGVGMFHAEENTAANTMAAISTAEIYFERPTYDARFVLRQNGRAQREYGSLFNPYWQVRLIDTPREQKLAAWALRDANVVEGLATGSSAAVVHYTNDQVAELAELNELRAYAESEINRIDGYELAEQQQSEIMANLDADIASTRSVIETLELQGAAQADIDAMQSELTAQLSQRAEASDAYQSAQHALEQARALEQQYAAIESQITQTSDRLNNADLSDVSDFTGDVGSAVALAENLRNGNLGDIRQQFEDYGREQLERAIEDQFTRMVEEFMADAVQSIISNYGGDYAAYADRAQEYADNFEQMADQAAEQYIEPLEAQIDAMQDGLATLEQDMRREVQATIDAMQAEISRVQAEMDTRVQLLEDQLTQRMEALEAQLAGAASDAERAAIQNDMDAVADQLANAPAELRQQLQQQVDVLQQRQQSLIDGMTAQLNETRQEVLREIARLEQQIQEIRDRLNG